MVFHLLKKFCSNRHTILIAPSKFSQYFCHEETKMAVGGKVGRFCGKGGEQFWNKCLRTFLCYISQMNVQLSMHSCGIKSYSPLLLIAFPCRNETGFWRKICCFWVQEISWTHTLQVAFYDFQQESSCLALLMMGKGQGLFFISEKRQGAFLTSKKGQGAILTFKKGQDAFLTFKKRAGRGALRNA